MPFPSAWLLLVDDDAQMLDLLVRALRREPAAASIHVETATTPDDALRAIDSLCEKPVVVLSDYDLKSTKTGIDLLRMVRARCPTAKRVLYSGHAREHIEPLLQPGDVEAYYEKPQRPHELVRPLLAHLSTARDDHNVPS